MHFIDSGGPDPRSIHGAANCVRDASGPRISPALRFMRRRRPYIGSGKHATANKFFVMSFQKVHANGLDFFSVCMCNQFKRYFNGKGHRDLTILASRTSDDDVEQVSDLSALVDPLRPERPFPQNFRTTRCSSLLSLNPQQYRFNNRS